MNKLYLLVFLSFCSLVLKDSYAKEIIGKQSLICSGSNSYSRAGGKIVTFDNVRESVVIYKFKLSRDDREKQRPIGRMKFANSAFPPTYYDSLQICGEDDLKLIFNSICTMSEDDWPRSVSSLESNCTLEKLTGKFSCEISVGYKPDKEFPEYGHYVTKWWDYDCKNNRNPVVQ